MTRLFLEPGVYAVPEAVPLYMRKYIKQGKHYLVGKSCDDVLFPITAEDGKPMSIRWDRCPLLGGQAWRRVVVESRHGNSTGINKNVTIHIRVHEPVKDKAQDNAKALGVSMAQYITDLIEQD